MKFYYAPGACSLGIHVLLEEVGKPYQGEHLNIRAAEQFKPEFVAINPKSKVPTLERDDGTVVTEFPAIAYWLARSNPESKLLPDGLDDQVKALEFMDFAVATMHMQGFSRIFRPANFSPEPAGEEKVKERGHEIFNKGFAIMDKALAGKEYLVGSFSIADAALFYVEYWAAARVKIALPPNVAAHYARMLARPAVKRAMELEGLAA